MEIKFEKAKQLKQKPNENNLGFGKHFTDYMFIMDYEKTKGWHDARIIPYGPIEMDPASMVFHYAQEVFDGLKAYISPEKKVLLFRPEMNGRRLSSSCERLSMAKISEEAFIEAVNALVKEEKDWIPKSEGTSLYIRPFVFATECGVGVHASSKYKFVIILSPVGAYYPEGVNPIKIYVEDEYTRASVGGTGEIKCGGNYASSIIAQQKAANLGYTQVLWLDGIHRKYIEEVGTMNVMFKINGEIYTAPLNGTILPGITRDSCIKMLKEWGYKVNEVPLSIDDLMNFSKNGKLEEAWGTGTAAVISPVGELNYKGNIMKINSFKTGDLTQKLYDELTGIQWGKKEDKFGWVKEVK
ncbi:MAG: branched-chain amino acid aminotransferase [Fusobacteriaceae bacterium]